MLRQLSDRVRGKRLPRDRITEESQLISMLPLVRTAVTERLRLGELDLVGKSTLELEERHRRINGIEFPRELSPARSERIRLTVQRAITHPTERSLPISVVGGTQLPPSSM